MRKIFYDFDCFYRRSFVFHQICRLFFLRYAAGRPLGALFPVFPFRFNVVPCLITSALCFFHPLTSFNLSCGAMPRRVQLMKQSPLTSPFLLSAVADSLRRPFPGDPGFCPTVRSLRATAGPARSREETSTHGTSPLRARNVCSTNGGGARRLWSSTMSTRASMPATTDSPLRPQVDRIAPVRAGAGAVRVDPVDGRRQGFHRTGRIPFHFPGVLLQPQTATCWN